MRHWWNSITIVQRLFFLFISFGIYKSQKEWNQGRAKGWVYVQVVGAYNASVRDCCLTRDLSLLLNHPTMNFQANHTHLAVSGTQPRGLYPFLPQQFLLLKKKIKINKIIYIYIYRERERERERESEWVVINAHWVIYVCERNRHVLEACYVIIFVIKKM